jgi:hypothetical protein
VKIELHENGIRLPACSSTPLYADKARRHHPEETVYNRVCEELDRLLREPAGPDTLPDKPGEVRAEATSTPVPVLLPNILDAFLHRRATNKEYHDRCNALRSI